MRAQGVQGRGPILYEIIAVDVQRDIFMKTHKMHKSESGSSCKLCNMWDNDVSAHLHQLEQKQTL